MTGSVVWVKPEGAELAEVELAEVGPAGGRPAGGTLSAKGTAIGADPLPYVLEYELTTGDDYITARLLVQARGAQAGGEQWRRTLELVNGPAGTWAIKAVAEGQVALPPPGGDAAGLAGALDCDLGLSPLTNTMPVLRSGLLDGGEPREFLMAWVSVPDLSVHPSRQTYTFVRRDGEHSIINYASPGFTQDIVFDSGGLVVDYPSIGRRVG